MRVYYDTEFLEDGKTIELISIGAVREDGQTYYAVNRDMPVDRILRHPWLNKNVWPYLPTDASGKKLNEAHSAVKPIGKIADEVHKFFTADWKPPEMWAYYGAYDHVRLMQLWGAMIDRPPNMPMWTNDLRQEMYRLGLTAEDEGFPQQGANLHKAIDDALWNKKVHEFLMQYAEENDRV